MEQRFRGRLTERAYDYTKGLLLDGELHPGGRVRVEDVVAALKTSRQPVMDAFKRLASEGFLEIIPQVGCRVVTPDPLEIADFFRLFAAAEGLTAEFAASRATEPERERLEAVHAQIGALTAGALKAERLAREYRALNRALHGQIHAMAHSRIVGESAAAFWNRSDFYISTASNGELVFARRVEEAHAEHAAIVAAIAARDDAAARSAMERHVLAFGRSSERHRAGARSETAS